METKYCTKVQLAFCLGLYGISLLLMLPTLWRSGFLFAWAGEILETVLTYGLLILGMYAMAVPFGKLLLVTSAAMLAAGNLAQPLLWFSCADDEKTAEIVGILLEKHVPLHIAGILVCWGMAAFLNRFSEKHPVPETILTVPGTIGLAVFILAVCGKGSNTSAFMGIQPAIPALFVGVVMVTLSLDRAPLVARYLHIVAVLALAGALGWHCEFGIPILCGSACLCAYWLVYPVPRVDTILVLSIIGGVIMIGIFLIKPELKIDLVNKLTERTDADHDHITSVLRNLRNAGVFGDPFYNTHVFAASSDFSLSTSIKFWGIAWICTVGAVFLLGTCRTLFNEKPHGFSFGALFPGFCACAYCVLVAYDLAMVLGCVPVVGVQCPLTGISSSFALLSGLLLGGFTCPDLKAVRLQAGRHTARCRLWRELIA